MMTLELKDDDVARLAAVIERMTGDALAVIQSIVTEHAAAAWDNGVDTAGQYAPNPVVVDDECKPLNPFRGVS